MINSVDAWNFFLLAMTVFHKVCAFWFALAVLTSTIRILQWAYFLTACLLGGLFRGEHQ